MSFQKIYFDYNIFCFLQDKETYSELYEKYTQLAEKYDFPYSAAHVEEIATIYRQDNSKVSKQEKDQRVEKILNTVSEISKSTVLRLDRSNRILTENEHPGWCLIRVIDEYEKTIFAENIDKLFSYQKNDKTQSEVHVNDESTFEDLRESCKIKASELGNLPPYMVFKDEKILSFFHQYVLDFNLVDIGGDTWSKIGDDKNKLQLLIERIMKGLYMVGYKADKYSKYRSGMHDISHAYYATSCNYFLTNDVRTGYLNRVRATYNLLKIPTKVINLGEFQEIN